MSNFEALGILQSVFKQILLVSLSCLFAFVGGFIGCITGAAIGQTTETGFLRGCGTGTLSGSLVALELAESIVNHNFISKVSISNGPMEGQVFTDWLTHVLLKAYDFQLNDLIYQSVMSDSSDIFDIEIEAKGLSLEHLNDLPAFMVRSRLDRCGEGDDEYSCPICLEELREGECGRKLNGCGHEYHLDCVDTWLVRRGTCPVCRHEIAA